MPTVPSPREDALVKVLPVAAPTDIRLELRSEPVEPTISLRDLLAALLRRWWIIALAAVVSAAAAYAFCQWVTPTYTASVILVPAESETAQFGSSGGLGALGQLAGLATGNDATQAGLATLASRQFMTEFIVKYRLRQALFDKQWDARARRWRPPEDGSDLDRRFRARDGGPNLEDAFYRFSKLLKVKQDSGTEVIRASLEWKDPVQAANWLNLMIKEVNTRFREKAIARSDHSIRYLTQQMRTEANQEVRTSIIRLIEAQMKRRTSIVVTPEFLFEVIDPAAAPVRPSFPQTPLICALAFIVGAIIAAGGVAIASSWRSSGEPRR